MDETTLKMAMAGFFHDMGKFADKDTLGVTERYFNDNAGIYLPFRDGRHTHQHALFSAAFIEQKERFLPPQLNSGGWGEGDAFINLAASHHNPETPMQQIITVADWLTSGMDRDVFDGANNREIAVRDYKKTRLLPLMEQLKNPDLDEREKFSYAYPLRPLSPESIFPEKKENREKTDAKAEYRTLFEGFTRDLELLRHREENVKLWFEHFESLLMVYASSIPAARVGNVVPDVSLYDHSRLTAAFAAALYLYHRETDSLEVGRIKNRKDRKFVLINGNFFGIQDFIFTGYGDSRKYRSKLLRGRSFYVSLLTEMAADMLSEAMGLPSISVILNAAGRFTLLAPNTETALAAAKQIQTEMNDWLVKISMGEVSMGFSSVTACYDDFINGRFMDLWEEMGRAGEIPKFQKVDLHRHGGVVADYLDRFDNRLAHALCPLCGKRPAEKGTEKSLPAGDAESVCSICRDHVLIGSRLVKKGRIVVAVADASSYETRDALLEPLFGRRRILFPSDDERNMPSGEHILKHWDISLGSADERNGMVTRKYVNGYVPFYGEEDLHEIGFLDTGKSEKKKLEMIDDVQVGAVKSLHHIAAASLTPGPDGRKRGVDALGILKADVDYLGMLMGCGLSGNRFTISRLAALSRQFNYYFALYLPYLLESEFTDVYTVFAGGDDLFLIGPWNRIYQLAFRLEKTFAAYVCQNPEVHFSAGITLQKAQTPLNTLAQAAEAALEKSKSEGRSRLTMFNETVCWENMGPLESIREEFERWLSEEWATKSMLYRLNTFIAMAAGEERVKKKGQVLIDDMECLKWRALLSYSAGRNIGKKIRNSDERKYMKEQLVGKMVDWMDRYRGNLRIPLWNVLYHHR